MKSGHEAFEILGYISVVATCLPAGITLFRGKKFPQQLLPLLIYAWLAAVFEIGGLILNKLSVNNLVLIHVFTILELTTLLFMYYFLFENKWLKWFMLPATICFALFAIWYMLYADDGPLGMNSLPRSVEATILIVCSVSYFLKLIRDMQVDNLMKLPMFWINTGVLLYFSGNLFLFTFSDFLLGPALKHFYEFWAMHSCLNIIFNGFLAYGLWQSNRLA